MAKEREKNKKGNGKGADALGPIDLSRDITDLHALAADYDKDAPMTKEFFATVQNRLHWAITGQTAAEIVYTRADAANIYMGPTTWQRGGIIASEGS